MPLEEIPANLQSNRSCGYTYTKPSSDAGSAASSVPAPPHSAIQSMLRNTTELGNIDQILPYQPHPPRARSRLRSTRRRSGSFDSSFASVSHHGMSPRPRQYRTGRGPSTITLSSRLSRHDTVRSNMMYHTPSSRARESGQGPQQQVCLRPMESPYPSRPLYSHRSLMALRSTGEHQYKHPNSPSMHPTQRLQRQRTFSSAFRPVFNHHQHVRGQYPRANSRTSATSSPASFRQPHREHPSYISEENGSLTSLFRLPSPAFQGVHSHLRATPHLSRYGTPSSLSIYGIRANSPASTRSAAAVSRPPSRSTIPQYYDYSESFMMHDQMRAENTLSGDFSHTIEQPIPEDRALQTTKRAQTPFGLKRGSTFFPAELPTRHNRRISETTVTRPLSEVPERRSSLGFDPQMASGASVEDVSAHTKTNSRHSNKDDGGMIRSSPTALQACVAPTPSVSQIYPSSGETRVQGDGDIACREAQLQARPRSRVGFNPTGSQALEETRIRSVPTSAAPTVHSRPTTSPTVFNTNHTTIISPRPERPLSSQSRKQFSKILKHHDFAPVTRQHQSESSIGVTNKVHLSSVHELPTSEILNDTLTVSETRAHQLGRRDNELYDATNNLRRNVPLSIMTNHGGSTIESLLDKHIESLGLGPDMDSSPHALMQSTHTSGSDHGETRTMTLSTSNRLEQTLTTSMRPVKSGSSRPASLENENKELMIPAKLFVSMNPRFISIPHAVSGPSIRELPAKPEESHSSLGWQTLTSNSQHGLPLTPRLPYIMSGELADIDTIECKKRFKIRRRSDMSRTSSLPEPTYSNAAETVTRSFEHKRTRSEVTRRQESRRRRHVKIRLKLQRRSRSLDQLRTTVHDVHNDAAQLPSQQSRLNPTGQVIQSLAQHCAELDGDSAVRLPMPAPNSESLPSPVIPKRWSSIMAEMPVPGIRVHNIIRHPSTRTQCSHRSKTSVTEPVNSTRLASSISKTRFQAPKLDIPDLGPPLVASDQRLSMLYNDLPSTVRPSLRATRSDLDDTPRRQLYKATRKKFGLSSLRSILPGSPRGSDLLNDFMQQTDRLRISHSCQLKGRHSPDDHLLPVEPTLVRNPASKQKRVVDKVRGWWQKQCVQKRLAARKVKVTQI